MINNRLKTFKSWIKNKLLFKIKQIWSQKRNRLIIIVSLISSLVLLSIGLVVAQKSQFFNQRQQTNKTTESKFDSIIDDDTFQAEPTPTLTNEPTG